MDPLREQQIIFAKYICISGEIGGQGGIRTHGELPPTTVFKTVALNHSATCPLTNGPLASAVCDGKRR